MPPKRARKAKRTVVVQTGDGFLSNVWSGIKKGHQFVKDQKLISRGLKLLPGAKAQMASNAAAALGYGRPVRRRRVTRRQHGGGIMLPGVVGASVIRI